MDLSSLPAEDQETVKNLLNEVEKYYEIFQSNMKNLKGRKVKRNAFSKINKQIIHSILIVFSDASGGKNTPYMDVWHMFEIPMRIILLNGCWLLQCLR